MDGMLADEMPPLLSATAANLQGAADTQAPASDQQQQQQQLVSQLADMLYSLAVLADTSHEDADTGSDADSSSSSSSGGSSAAAHWYQCSSMQQLLDAVATLGNSWDVDSISRKVCS
jgi:hypothetical protein